MIPTRSRLSSDDLRQPPSCWCGLCGGLAPESEACVRLRWLPSNPESITIHPVDKQWKRLGAILSNPMRAIKQPMLTNDASRWSTGAAGIPAPAAIASDELKESAGSRGLG